MKTGTNKPSVQANFEVSDAPVKSGRFGCPDILSKFTDLGATLKTDLMFSSNTDLWATPQDFFDRLHEVFRFDTDVCALPENAKCGRFFQPSDDGLAQEWKGVCWMNPPYGRKIGVWVEKAYRSAKENGATVVCLLPARVDTRWWHDFCRKGEVTFIKGRLKFGGSKTCAPFPSAVVVFRPAVSDAIADAS